jgi:hypothetical protein
MHEKAEVLTTTESRQASPRRLNLRVLVMSMIALVVIGAALYFVVYQYPNSAIGVPDEPAATDTQPAGP